MRLSEYDPCVASSPLSTTPRLSGPGAGASLSALAVMVLLLVMVIERKLRPVEVVS
jgi:hypothetical protein